MTNGYPSAYFGALFHKLHPQPTGIASAAIDNTASFSAVDEFLQAIPSDYYAVQQIDDFKGMLQDKEALLIDVRELSEFRHDHSGCQEYSGAISDSQPGQNPQGPSCHSLLLDSHGLHGFANAGYSNIRGFPPSIQGWKPVRAHRQFRLNSQRPFSLISSHIQQLSLLQWR